MENIVMNILASVAIICGTGLFGTLITLLPDGSILPTAPAKKYYTVQVSRTITKRVEVVEKEWADPGYEKGTHNAPRIAARFNPFQFATSEEMVMWDNIADEDSKVQPSVWCYVRCEESEEIPDVSIDELEYEPVAVDERVHLVTCDCFTCRPFGTSKAEKLARVKTNTKLLVQEIQSDLPADFYNDEEDVYDTIGNPDHADKFYDSYATPERYEKWQKELDDQEQLAQDWYDNQLYV